MSLDKRPLVEPHSDIRLEKLHIVLLMMLDDFADICKKNDICWIGMYGTAIGALRHKGFIPWDDDIDICMPREDHDKFCEIVQRDYSDKYEIVNPLTCPNYPMTTTRFILKGTEFRDANLATMDFDSGIFLDLFPLDYLADDEKAFKKQAWHCWLYNKLAIARAEAQHAKKLLNEYYGDWMQKPPVSLYHGHYPNILYFGEYEPRVSAFSKDGPNG